jgi:hypothetical protein
MPIDWVPPALFFTYRGVEIYHCYDDDSFQMGTMENWYTTLECGSIAEDFDPQDNPIFDVTELSSYRMDLTHEDIIKAAIDGGEFEGWDGIPDPLPEPTKKEQGIYPASDWYAAAEAKIASREYDSEDFAVDYDKAPDNLGNGSLITLTVLVTNEEVEDYADNT